MDYMGTFLQLNSSPKGASLGDRYVGHLLDGLVAKSWAHKKATG